MTDDTVGASPSPASVRVVIAVLCPFVLTFLALLVTGSQGPAEAGEGAQGTTTIPAPDPAAAPAPADLLRAGEALYLQNCVSCHAAGGKATDDGPALIAAGEASANFFLRTGRMPLANPVPQSPYKPVAFTEPEIRALVAYVGSLCDRTISTCPTSPDVNPGAGTLTEGNELFLANCAPCHGSVGVGGALSTGNAAPSLQNSAAQQVGEAIRIGPGQMPPFGPEVLSDHEVDSIVRYVTYLHRPDHPGGVPLGYTGPVAEGFVALLLGLGAMFLSIRWITREAREVVATSGNGGRT